MAHRLTEDYTKHVLKRSLRKRKRGSKGVERLECGCHKRRVPAQESIVCTGETSVTTVVVGVFPRTFTPAIKSHLFVSIKVCLWQVCTAQSLSLIYARADLQCLDKGVLNVENSSLFSMNFCAVTFKSINEVRNRCYMYLKELLSHLCAQKELIVVHIKMFPMIIAFPRNFQMPWMKLT